jgi:hypothetical protein
VGFARVLGIVPLVLLLLRAAPARAEPRVPPLVIEPFSNRCFDAAHLAERLRAELPRSAISIGSAPAGAYHLVRVTADTRSLVVHFVVRNERHRTVGSEERLLPLGDDCGEMVQTAALIIARAATPIAFRPPPPRVPSRPSESRPSESRPSENRPSESRPSENRPSENRPSESRPSENRPSESRPSENRPSENRPAESRPSESRPSESRPSENRPPESRPSEDRPKPVVPTPAAPEPSPGAAVELRARPAEHAPHHRLEIDVAAQWAFPLDGPPSTPAGELTLGWRLLRGRRAHFGVGIRTGVSGDWTAERQTPSGAVSVTARRIPLSAELRLDLDVPRARGVVRLSAGPQVAFWLAHSTGLPHPGSALAIQPGAFVRAAYRLELGRVILCVGLDLDAAFVRNVLSVGGVGQVAKTPVVQLLPFVGAGLGFL